MAGRASTVPGWPKWRLTIEPPRTTSNVPGARGGGAGIPVVQRIDVEAGDDVVAGAGGGGHDRRAGVGHAVVGARRAEQAAG